MEGTASAMWLRIVFVTLTCFIGAAFGWSEGRPAGGFLFGLLASGLAVSADVLLRRLSPQSLLGGTFGLLCGAGAAFLITSPLSSVQAVVDYRLDLLIYAMLGFAGLSIGLSRGEGLSLSKLAESLQATPPAGTPKLIDTSAIIDGRIADVCETRFVEGPFLIPQFVLRELQHIADSEDPKKRARGRRGLDILRRIQKSSAVEVRIVDTDFPRIREVDEKLVALARSLGARLVTTDYNLNKVCEVQGIGVLNVNDLANALRAVVLPGEILRVQITKEGKEPQQGVAYLDDGTMVVIENGAALMGRKLDVTVTSVLQTTAGRMIFSKPRDENQIREEAA